jgi:hypothetical protein
MAVGLEQLQVVSADTGQKVDEIPTFANQQEYDNWWNVSIQGVPPRTLDDLDVVAVIQGTNNQLKRFRDIPSAQRWIQQLAVIRGIHGPNLRHIMRGGVLQ